MSGAWGTNECPAGSVRIEAEAACRTAALATGKTPSTSNPFVQTRPDALRGCYYLINNTAYFNADAVGRGSVVSLERLLCADLAVTTGAPLTRRCADARVLRGTRGRCV